MQKLTIGVFILFISTFTWAQQQNTTPSFDPNAVTQINQCDEFKQNAGIYEKKAEEQSIYSEKYLLISVNFMKMYQQCIDEIRSSQRYYHGYRSNAIQQQRQSQQNNKR